MKRYLKLVVLSAFVVVATGGVHAQSAFGNISGTVTDSSGAVIPNATVTIINQATSAAQNVTSNENGLYSAAELVAGRYRVRATIQGFQTEERDAEVQPGGVTTVNMQLTVGAVSQVVEVSEATAQMNYESHAISGVVEQQNIANLPMNGRSFVQLASLQPGVQVVTQAQGLRNAPLGITIFGGGGQYPLVTVDGLQINDFNDGNAGAGTAINFSQDVIQEFQLSSANFDLSTFTTIQGAVNMVTRSGGNAIHGEAYYFYRDHNMAAYPGLAFNSFNPHPYFVRKDPGALISGPIIKDKLFYFGSYENTDQEQVVAVQPDLASIQGLASLFPSPNAYHYTTVRLDYRQSAKNTMFLRWTQDRNQGFGLGGGAALPSQWVNNWNWSEQYAIGVTTVFTSNLVNDFRFGFRDWHNTDNATSEAQCVALEPNCVGGQVSTPGAIGGAIAPNGLPNLSMIGSSNFAAGDYSLTPQDRVSRNFEPQDTISWVKGKHRLQGGFDMDYYNEEFYYPLCLRGCMSVYSVETTRSTLAASASCPSCSVNALMPNAGSGTSLPSTINNSNDILALPMSYPAVSLTSGWEIGAGQTPGPWNYSSERKDYRPRVFFQDFWKIRPNLTINYGLAYAYESGLWPTDMPIPAIEGPLYGLAPATTQSPTPTDKLNFSPGFGFNYSPGKSGKLVIRGGAGLYYDTGNYVQKLHTIANEGPIGNGPVALPSNLFTMPNPIPASWGTVYEEISQSACTAQGGGTETYSGFCPMTPGLQLPTSTFTTLTLSEFMQIYNSEFPSIQAQVTPSAANPWNGSSSVLTHGSYQYSNVDMLKACTVCTNSKNPMPRSYQTSIGLQYDFGHNLVVSADWVQRDVVHNSLGQIDLNHTSEYIKNSSGTFVKTPAIAACTNAQLFIPANQCSTGAFSIYINEGHALYEGLLIRANKSLSHNYQFIVSYAFQTLDSESVINLNNYWQGYGPTLAHHNLNIAGIGHLPWGFQLSLNSSFISRTPVEVTTTSDDLSGTGATGSGPLPGLAFRGLPNKAALANAVSTFNSTYVGTKTPSGHTVTAFVLPPSYELGRPTDSQDFRLTKEFPLTRLLRGKEGYKLALYGEVFNSLNIANKTGYSFALDTQVASGTQTYAFGQPTARAGQVFLSSGPRAEQVGARISF